MLRRPYCLPGPSDAAIAINTALLGWLAGWRLPLGLGSLGGARLPPKKRHEPANPCTHTPTQAFQLVMIALFQGLSFTFGG